MCDLTTIVKDHMKTLMRLFEEDLADYNMKQMTTKCLNTAVLIMYMFLGARALHHTYYCDVDNVVARANDFRNRQQTTLFWQQMQRNIARCKKSILKNDQTRATIQRAKQEKKPKDERCLYYIMITHAETPDHGMFPGHVFILDKTTIPHLKYDLYQSYVQEYDLTQFISMNSGTTRKSEAYVHDIMHGLQTFFTKKVWDKECSAWWRMLTHVNGEVFEGYPIENTLFFCYQEIPIRHCTHKLGQLLRERIPSVREQDPVMHAELNRIVQKLEGGAK